MRIDISLSGFYKLIDYIFPAYLLVYFFEFYFGLWGLSTLVKLISILLTLFFSKRILRRASINCKGFHQFYNVYYAYVILSGIMYLFNGIPLRCYLNEVYNSIPAMFFVYVGMAEPGRERSFFDKFLKATTICMLMGLFLYVTTPEWFVNRRIEVINNAAYNNTVYGEDSMLQSLRFSSYLIDTYEAYMYVIIGLAIAFFLLYMHGANKKRFMLIVIIIINFVSAILTQQRVAMAAAISIGLFYIFWGYIRGKGRYSSQLIFISLLTVALFSAVLLAKYGDRVIQMMELVEDRFENISVSKALDERTNQYDNLFRHWDNPILGMGAGSGGAVAGRFSLPHVNDGAYMELLYEFGIVGMLMFAVLMIKTLYRGIKHMSYYLTELIVIAFVLVAMIGANTLTLAYMIIYPFWYCVGRIWNNDYYRYAVEKRLKV